MSDHSIGITPMLRRFAFSYLLKGEGSHAVLPPFDAFYDEIVVRKLYDWIAPVGDVPPQGGAAVEFWKKGRRVRWVEFGVRQIGGGGDLILQEV